MIDEDEVSLKEKPEDTWYIKKLLRNETRIEIKNLIPNFMPFILGTAVSGWTESWRALWGDDIPTQGTIPTDKCMLVD